MYRSVDALSLCPSNGPDDLRAGAHRGVVAAGGMAGAMAGDAADAGLVARSRYQRFSTLFESTLSQIAAHAVGFRYTRGRNADL